MTRSSSITPFPSVTLATKNFRWLEQTAWDDWLTAYFAAKRRFLLAQIYQPPPFVHRKGPHPDLAMRWLLTPPGRGDEAWGWAELQRFPGSFQKGVLIIGADPKADVILGREAASILASAIMIVGRLDLVWLLPADPSIKEWTRDFGVEKKVTTFNPLAWGCQHSASTIVDVSPIEIDPFAWWETELGSRSRAELSYLVKRREREDVMAQKKKTPPTRRGILSRIFRPWGV